MIFAYSDLFPPFRLSLRYRPSQSCLFILPNSPTTCEANLFCHAEPSAFPRHAVPIAFRSKDSIGGLRKRSSSPSSGMYRAQPEEDQRRLLCTTATHYASLRSPPWDQKKKKKKRKEENATLPPPHLHNPNPALLQTPQPALPSLFVFIPRALPLPPRPRNLQCRPNMGKLGEARPRLAAHDGRLWKPRLPTHTLRGMGTEIRPSIITKTTT